MVIYLKKIFRLKKIFLRGTLGIGLTILRQLSVSEIPTKTFVPQRYFVSSP